MEELKVEQTVELETRVGEQETTETHEITQPETEKAVSYGKFKDATALLEAYNNLQSEFTKRCQRVKELETKLSAVDKESTPTGTETEKESKEDVLKTYLKEVLQKKQSAILLDGAGLGTKAPVERPRTFNQAGQLAIEIFKK